MIIEKAIMTWILAVCPWSLNMLKDNVKRCFILNKLQRCTTNNAEQIWQEIKKNKFIYFLLAPTIILVIVFNYVPFYGVKMAFQEYNIYDPSKSEWVGLNHFAEIFSSKELILSIWNTIYISILNIIIVFPMSIIFALLLNEVKDGLFKRSVQTFSYLPHFLSWISVIGIVTALYAKNGPINDFICMLTGSTERRLFMAEQGMFVPNVILLSTWKELGWGSVVFLAAISGIDAALYEAAIIDGAGKLRQAWSVTIPQLMPTIVIMLVWKIGSIFSSNFDLIYGMQNAFINFETIQTVIYKQGIQGGDYAMTTAFGLAQGLVNIIMLLFTNAFAKKAEGISVF